MVSIFFYLWYFGTGKRYADSMAIHFPTCFTAVDDASLRFHCETKIRHVVETTKLQQQQQQQQQFAVWNDTLRSFCIVFRSPCVLRRNLIICYGLRLEGLPLPCANPYTEAKRLFIRWTNHSHPAVHLVYVCQTQVPTSTKSWRTDLTMRRAAWVVAAGSSMGTNSVRARKTTPPPS